MKDPADVRRIATRRWRRTTDLDRKLRRWANQKRAMCNDTLVSPIFENLATSKLKSYHTRFRMQ